MIPVLGRVKAPSQSPRSGRPQVDTIVERDGRDGQDPGGDRGPCPTALPSDERDRARHGLPDPARIPERRATSLERSTIVSCRTRPADPRSRSPHCRARHSRPKSCSSAGATCRPWIPIRFGATSTRSSTRRFDEARPGLARSTIIGFEQLEDAATLPRRPLIPTITLAELSVGPLVASDAERATRLARLQQVESDYDPLPFDASAARAFGRVAASLRRGGRKPSAPTYDAMIAAIALANDLPLYTCKPRNLSDIEGFGGGRGRPTALTGRPARPYAPRRASNLPGAIAVQPARAPP